jgi:pimeloyl-ACP methyl ester carboxylesterase
VISVDRPSIGDTDPLLALSTAAEKQNADPFLHHIKRHADDVLAVLEHEDITKVYILAVCLGIDAKVAAAR